MNSIEAYLDNYGLLNVYVDHQFYYGKCDSFYLVNDKDIYSCVIKSIDIQSSVTRYELVIPCNYDFSLKYYLIDNHGYKAQVQIRWIVKTPRFNETYYYDGDDLGVVYHKDYSVFKVFAPTANNIYLHIKKGLETNIYVMKRNNSIFEFSVNGDLDGCFYYYMIDVNGQINKALDPYAISGNANSDASAIVDWSKYDLTQDVKLEPMKRFTDAIIYELSVRDFTHSVTSGTKTHSLFNSLCEDNTSYRGMKTGLNYLKSLGITHVQLMPVFDFATVDELHPSLIYNWGYDPIHYLTLEGSYSSNPNDAHSRVFEFKNMINILHANGIKVNLDVVFNHHYDVKLSMFDKLVPYYYFRTTATMNLSNGSYCGNDFESRQVMSRKYITDVCCKLIELYDIDGLRFDLMGLIDVDTMNIIKQKTRSMKSDFMIYGEGWNLPTYLPNELKSTKENYKLLKDIGFFNDVFRDVVKGKSMENQIYDRGYICGNVTLINEYKNALLGFNDVNYKLFDSLNSTINYVESHDNQTSWDKLKNSCKGESNAIRVKRHKMMIASCMMALGIPFIHSGQEFCRTKGMMHNTYNASDSINEINYDRLLDYKEVYYYFIELTKLRKKYDVFRVDSLDDITFACNEFSGMLKLDLNEIRIFINPTLEDKNVINEGYHRIFDECGFTNEDSNVINSLTIQVYIKD